MRHKNRYDEKPEVNQLIYWHGPNGKDILGWYRGSLNFQEYEPLYPGFLPQWWHPAPEGLVPDPLMEELIPKRKYIKRKNI